LSHWVDKLCELATADMDAVVVSIVTVLGSSPREAGAKMIVTATDCIGSVGGGELEFQCTAVAAGLIGQNGQAILRKFVLGASLGQCCGGVVEVLFEPVSNGVPGWLAELHKINLWRQNAVLATSLDSDPPQKLVISSTGSQPHFDFSDMVLKEAHGLIDHGGAALLVDEVFLETVAVSNLNIAIFGAGHVGSALVATLAGLDANIRWIDSREGVFQQVPRAVHPVCPESPVLEVNKMPPSSFYLVMTHSHKLDLEICAAVLSRSDALYCGLIGSVSKRRRFEKQFRQLGLGQAVIDTLVCPIGIDGISGKQPKEIAIAAAAEILQVYGRGPLSPNNPD